MLSQRTARTGLRKRIFLTACRVPPYFLIVQNHELTHYASHWRPLDITGLTCGWTAPRKFAIKKSRRFVDDNFEVF